MLKLVLRLNILQAVSGLAALITAVKRPFSRLFKAQTVGSPVYFGDNMIIESVLISENYLHTSEGEGATG